MAKKYRWTEYLKVKRRYAKEVHKPLARADFRFIESAEKKYPFIRQTSAWRKKNEKN
tara:strand:+ start:221 stop:391 length:171 start_codon:yes stop_codon:yes gene_type:complete